MPEPTITCRQCGLANPASNNFCGRCGTHLAARPPTPMRLAGRPTSAREDARNRQNVRIIYAITTLFALSCIVLTLVVIIWRP